MFSEQTGDQQRALFIPSDQTKGDWRDMWSVTMARGTGAPDLPTTAERAASEYEQSCNAYTASPPQRDTKRGYLTAFWTMGCQRRRNEASGEASFFLFLQGEVSVYLVQRIWRLPPFGKEGPPIQSQARNDAIDVLKNVRICNPATQPGGCQSGANR